MWRYFFPSLSRLLPFFCFFILLSKPSLLLGAPDAAISLQQQLSQATVFSFNDSEMANLRRFYAHRQHQPAWITPSADFPKNDRVLKVIATTDAEGLDSRDYQLPRLQQLQQQMNQSPDAAIELELRTTHALLQLAQDLARGQLSAKTVDPDWHIARPEFDAVKFLHDAIEADRVQSAFASLPPQTVSYRLLKQALSHYLKLAQDNTRWVQIPVTPSLHPGDTHTIIPLIRRRIAQAYDADGIPEYRLAPSENQHYDTTLVTAIRAFQEQHGLNPDGVIGKNTIKALNTPLDWKIRQLRINMERLRWLPRELSNRYLLVNTAGFFLSAIENEQQVLNMRIIVGRDYRSTPSFNSAVTHMVINPYWNVPASIARKDLLPKQQQNPEFFASSDFQVYPGHDRNAQPIDPDTIDWNKYEHSFPFFLRQQPGKHNALGKVKFMFANPFSIYLHDTPSKSLFKRDMRTFSSGCIRLEKPLELAAFALSQASLLEKFNENIADDETLTTHLPKPLPIYLVYITAWADEPQQWVHFYPDIYNRDLNALRHARW